MAGLRDVTLACARRVPERPARASSRSSSATLPQRGHRRAGARAAQEAVAREVAAAGRRGSRARALRAPLRADGRAAQRLRRAARLRVDDLALTTSTSEGLGKVLAGMDIGPGDEIVTSSDEHPGLIGPLIAARQRGAEIRRCRSRSSPTRSARAPRSVACSHINWRTGEVAPETLADTGVPVIFDGAQGAGAVPVDVGKLGCAVYAAAGQKWLCGADGTGMLYIAPEFRERVRAIAPAYICFEDASRGFESELKPDARRYDTPALAARSSPSASPRSASCATPTWARCSRAGPRWRPGSRSGSRPTAARSRRAGTRRSSPGRTTTPRRRATASRRPASSCATSRHAVRARLGRRVVERGRPRPAARALSRPRAPRGLDAERRRAPPSTGTTAPLTKLAAGDSRCATTSATSAPCAGAPERVQLAPAQRRGSRRSAR